MADDNSNTITHELNTTQGSAQAPAQSQVTQQNHEESLKHSYEDLARRDRELHEREVAFKEGQRAIKQLAELRQRAKDDPFGVTRDLGIDTLALGDAILGEDRGQPELDSIDVYAQKIQELEQWKQQQELRLARAEQKRAIRRILRADEGTDYGILRSLHGDYGDQIEEEALVLAEDAYRRTGESQDYRKILTHLEEQKEKEYYALTERFGSINKIKEKSGVNEQPANLPRESGINQGKPAPLTLSNDMSGQPAQETKHPLTREDRRRLFLQSDFFKK